MQITSQTVSINPWLSHQWELFLTPNLPSLLSLPPNPRTMALCLWRESSVGHTEADWVWHLLGSYRRNGMAGVTVLRLWEQPFDVCFASASPRPRTGLPSPPHVGVAERRQLRARDRGIQSQVIYSVSCRPQMGLQPSGYKYKPLVHSYVLHFRLRVQILYFPNDLDILPTNIILFLDFQAFLLY